MKDITKGSIVRYKNDATGHDGWMEVRAVFKNTVNLGSIFQGRTTLKSIPIAQVTPDYDAWYATWQKSEAYQCM